MRCKVKKETTMKQIFIEFVVPDVVEAEYRNIYNEFEKKISALHGLTYDSFQAREFDIDEIPF